MSAEAKKPVTSSLSVRALRGGFIVSYKEPQPTPWYLLQQAGIAAVQSYSNREIICPTLNDVNKLVAELLVGTP